MATNYQHGATFEIRGERWTLAREQRFASCRLLTLGGAEPANAALTLRVVDPFDRPRPLARRRLHRRPRRASLRAALGAVASARTDTGLWSAANAAITVLPYQLEPALAVVGGATRLLLADAVGLGKTVQAGLILAELRARGWMERAVIVCPSGLRDTWARELRERFDLHASIVDQAALSATVATLPPGANPWGGDSIAIVSVDLLKRPEVLAAVEQVPIDLLIADEAHHLSPGTDRGAAVARLASRIPWVALLSATPHSGDAAAFSYLTAIGAHGDPLTIFRRTRGDIGAVVRRRTHLLPVAPIERERALFEAVDRYARAIWSGRGRGDRAVRLVAITIARRAASSAPALLRTLSRRIALLAGDAPPEPEQGQLPWDESDTADEIEEDTLLAARGLDDPVLERQTLEHLLGLAQQCERGSKLERLLRLLGRIREPALVFTEYRDTLQAIASRLDGASYCVLHGGMSADARRKAVARFTDGSVRLLLATDAAGEGLNLHYKCRLVIDVELPWNPLRLEQRIGRVDRIGQKRTVHAIRLFHRDTIEARVLEHLRMRRRTADAAMDECAGQQSIADAVFEDRPVPSRPSLPPARVVPSATGEADRIIWQRAARALGASSATRCWTPPRSGPLFAVYRATLVSRTGWPIADRIEACAISFARPPANRREWRRLVEWLAQHPTLSGPHVEETSARDGLRNRIESIRSMLLHRARVEYQRSLFDGRADSDAAARDATAAQLIAALDRTLLAATSFAGGCVRCELIAAWPGHRR